MSKIQLKNVRLSYAQIFQATTPANEPTAPKKFSSALLWPANDPQNGALIQEAINNAIAKGISDGKFTAQQAQSPKFDNGIRTEQDRLGADGQPSEEYRGMLYINAKSDESRPPQVVDGMLRPITDQSLLYSGAYANVFVDAYAYENRGNIGIGWGLLGLQKTADGDPLGNTFSAASEFTAIETDYGSTQNWNVPGQQAPGGQVPGAPQPNYGAPQQQTPAPGSFTPGGGLPGQDAYGTQGYGAPQQSQAPAPGTPGGAPQWTDTQAQPNYGAQPQQTPGFNPNAQQTPPPTPGAGIDFSGGGLPRQ